MYNRVAICYTKHNDKLWRNVRYADRKEEVLPSKVVFMAVANIIPTSRNYSALGLP